MLQIEGIGGVCSASCEFCPLVDRKFYKNDRPVGVMSMDLFQKIIDEAATISQLESVCITGLSETLLDKYLLDRIWYMREVLPEKVRLDFFTNGYALSPAKFDAVKEAGVNGVTVSLNAISADQHNAIMHMGTHAFPIIVANIEYALAHAGDVWVEIKAVMDKVRFTKEHGDEFYAKWGQRGIDGGHGQLVYEGNWAGEVENDRVLDPASMCTRALTQIYVLWDGIVTLCCFDPLGRGARELTGHPDGLGNLNHQTIREIYNQPVYTQFRFDHSINQADKYPVCANCTRI